MRALSVSTLIDGQLIPLIDGYMSILVAPPVYRTVRRRHKKPDLRPGYD
jgi:hypothetical protein